MDQPFAAFAPPIREQSPLRRAITAAGGNASLMMIG